MKAMIALAGLGLIAMVVGCGKKNDGTGGESLDEESACGPASVVGGGKTVEVKKALVVWEPKYKVTILYGFNHTEATCENALKGSFSVPDGSISFRVSDSSTDTVGVSSYTHMGSDVKVSLRKKVGKVGDTAELCLDKVTFTPIAGHFKEQEVTMSGKFVGEYCGELSQ